MPWPGDDVVTLYGDGAAPCMMGAQPSSQASKYSSASLSPGNAPRRLAALPFLLIYLGF